MGKYSCGWVSTECRKLLVRTEAPKTTSCRTERLDGCVGSVALAA